MSCETLKKNIETIVKNKNDDDIINTLLYIKESINEINTIAENLNISFAQLKKASDKTQKDIFEEKSVLNNIDNLIEYEKEEDIISALITLTSILSETEAVLKDTPFEIDMVYKSLKFNIPKAEEKPVEAKKEKPQPKEDKKPVEAKKDKLQPKEEKPQPNPNSTKKEEEQKKPVETEELETEDLIF